MSPRRPGPKFKATRSRSQRSQLRVPHRRRFHTALGHAHRALSQIRAWTWRSSTGARPGWRIRSSAFISLTRCHFASPSRHAKAWPNLLDIAGLYRQFELIYIVADERDSIRVRRNYRHGEDVHLYRTTFSPPEARERFLEYIQTINVSRTNRAGTMPLPLTAPPAFALSGPATSVHHGTGEFSLTERVTSCSTSVTSSPPAVFPLASSSSAAGSTNLRAQQTRIRISRASSAQICRRPTSGSAQKLERL